MPFTLAYVNKEKSHHGIRRTHDQPHEKTNTSCGQGMWGVVFVYIGGLRFYGCVDGLYISQVRE